MGAWPRDHQVWRPASALGPTVPQGFAVYAGAAFAHLSWGASTDDSGQVFYRVERNGQTRANSVSAANYVNRSASPNTTSTYSVRAADLSGNLSDPTPPILP